MIEALAPPLLAATRGAWLALPAEGLVGRAGELDCVAGVTERRRQHFLAGRACAHRALEALGSPTATIGRDDNGAPRWPGGVTGSIGHCDAGAVAVVARDGDWLALGVDVEPQRPLPDDVAGYALTAVERTRFAVASGGLAHWGLVAFCAKECVHKCLQPLRGSFLDFHEVEIMFGDQDRFTPMPRSAEARAMLAGQPLEGSWRVHDGCVLAVLGIAAPALDLR